MDVKGLQTAVIAVLSLVALSACNEPKTSESVHKNTSTACQPSAVESRYLVRWETGAITVEHGSSREQFNRDFVEPNLKNISFVEQDQLIPVIEEPVVDRFFTESTVGEIDGLWGLDAVGAPEAWQSAEGKGVVVAVIDSGLDVTHPLLVDQLATNSGESGRDSSGADKQTNGKDDDGNGFVDDYYGYDFATETGDLSDNSGHGTHVAGIIAASHNGPQDSAKGVAPKAKIMGLDFMDSKAGGRTSDAIRAIAYAVSRGVHVINASWGGGQCSLLLREAIAELQKSDILFVGAAGNRSSNVDVVIEFPASFNLTNQITVGSFTVYGGMAEHSNYGDRAVHLFAPGVDILSTLPGDSMGLSRGTSMAAPFVTGAVALLKSYRPQASADQIRQALFDGVTVDNWYRNATKGRLNIPEALSSLSNSLP